MAGVILNSMHCWQRINNHNLKLADLLESFKSNF